MVRRPDLKMLEVGGEDLPRAWIHLIINWTVDSVVAILAHVRTHRAIPRARASRSGPQHGAVLCAHNRADALWRMGAVSVGAVDGGSIYSMVTCRPSRSHARSKHGEWRWT